MTANIEPTESAFPVKETQTVPGNVTGTWGEKEFIHFGLTKREWFVGMAMHNIAERSTPENCAKWAVRYADALIEELNKEEIK